MHRINRFAWQWTGSARHRAAGAPELRQAARSGLWIVLALLSASAFSQAGSSLPTFDAVSVKPFAFPNRPWNRRAQIDPQRLYIEGMAPVEFANQQEGCFEWFDYLRLLRLRARLIPCRALKTNEVRR
ncbi:MAG TPA: hypothetical protein VN692_02110 [Steroidobacteraceae bacterium]|nr:hypothetical protein [Steroidobacteraceae bacterium]